MYVDTVNTGVCDFYTTLYTVYSILCIQGLLPLQEGRLIVAISPVGLVVHQSEGTALLTFWDLSTTRVIAGWTHHQSPILKSQGGPGTPGSSYRSTNVKVVTQASAILYNFEQSKVNQFSVKCSF